MNQLVLWICKILFSGQFLQDIIELYGEEGFSTTRYRLYQAATKLYEEKQVIEDELYSLCTNLFSQGSKIVVYDLTNLYVEGRMAARE